MTSIYDMIYKIDNSFGKLHFEKIEGFSLVGEPLSDSYIHPIQYRALTNTLPGMDDPFEGVGWTPSVAIGNLLKVLLTQ